MSTQIARGYSRMAIELERHIGDFIPTGFGEEIRVFGPVPGIAYWEAEEFCGFYKEGTLAERLKTYMKKVGGMNGTEIWPFNQRDYIHEAIIKFFETGQHIAALEEADEDRTRMAERLYLHISLSPSGSGEPIGGFSPRVSGRDAGAFYNSFMSGDLRDTLKTYKPSSVDGASGIRWEWPVKEAIVDFFEQGLHEEQPEY